MSREGRRLSRGLGVLALAFVVGCAPAGEDRPIPEDESPSAAADPTTLGDEATAPTGVGGATAADPQALAGTDDAAGTTAAASGVEQARDTAVFAGGCFWCMEPPYDEIEGVYSTVSGYAGGHVPNPTYEQVTQGDTGHREVVRVIYDPQRVDYGRLLDVFWRNVDPLDAGGQFCDRGFSYTTAIYAKDEEQARLARASKAKVERRLEGDVVTPVEPWATFYAAEDYHQDYYRENPVRYKFYRWNCGRDARLEEVWGDAAG